jgi:hypothetical protein
MEGWGNKNSFLNTSDKNFLPKIVRCAFWNKKIRMCDITCPKTEESRSRITPGVVSRFP